jgi:hypothetical protein
MFSRNMGYNKFINKYVYIHCENLLSIIVLKVSYKSSKQNIIRKHGKMVLGHTKNYYNFSLISYYLIL